MKLAVLGSGSRGNAVALRAHGVTLLIDAGFGPRALGRRAAEAGVPLEPLAGIVLTHEHGDHARGAVRLAARTGCPLLATAGTLAAVTGTEGNGTVLPPFGDAARLGPFTIEVARTAHDAREPVAVVVSCPDGRRVGVAWDLGRPTAAVRHLLRGVHALILEANHDEVMLRTGPYPASVRQRIGGSTGHLSNRLAADLAADVCTPALEVVVLAHVSEQCNDGVVARRTVGQALRAHGFRGRLLLARQEGPLAAFSLRPTDQLRLRFPEPAVREAALLPSPLPPAPAPTPGPSA